MTASGPSSKAKIVALHLVAYEAIGESHSETARPAAFQVCEKLRGPLSTLTGAAGFRSILVRALCLAKQDAPVLAAVEIKNDGSLEGLSCNSTELGGTMLVAQLLGLLMTFIGDALTMRLLVEIWPDLRGVELDSEGKE